ncbi:serine/threonine-protein kinase SBK1 isoform X2 [Latimeria chalumnae]|uniref:Protein kinase domain-containing protein n=2 Tax=Latimeria chalumnae TaxID=7897 RepID=H2ZY14_LATCH|nr:PREDICTED: serine/threonine-protein kinase SBK1-like [Latimeria chalumnae]|eukprot:XP_006005690.1 PREDICTED: serine/threonine-protein kinase SBK1-like [Latimeria chalumnae]
MNLNEAGGSADLLEEMLELTSQNLTQMELKDHYSIIRELGQGSYGHVLLVIHRARGTPIALKLLRKKSTKLRNFLLEYCISLSVSSHPCMVGMFGIVFETKHHYGFAQEVASFGDLFSIIEPGVGIPEISVKRCALQVSSALDFLHNKGLVHRDIKPENILLFDKDCRRVKLTDFGLTRRKGTIVRPMSGTIPYTAPELCNLGSSEGLAVDSALDVWAFGVLLFCILTGFFPWETTSGSDTYYVEFENWQKNGKALSIPSQWKRFDNDILPMFQKFLAIEPTQRGPAIGVLEYIRLQWKVANWNLNGNSVDNSKFLDDQANVVDNEHFINGFQEGHNSTLSAKSSTRFRTFSSNLLQDDKWRNT